MRAPCTAAPQAVTWNRAVTLVVPNVIVLGETCAWSTRRRAGEETCAIRMLPLLALPQPLAAGGVGAGAGVSAALMTAVGTDVAVVLPSAFVAVTRKRIVLPTSTFLRTYPAAPSVAPLMLAQLPPFSSHRWKRSW